MSKYGRKLTQRICGFGIIVLILGLTTAYLGAYDYLPIDPTIVVPVTLILVILFGCAGSASMMAGTSFITFMPFSRQPASPEGVFKRYVKDRETGQEYIISGTKECTFREAILHDWSILNRNRSSQWYIVDEFGNDITDRFLYECDSLTEIIFEDY